MPPQGYKDIPPRSLGDTVTKHIQRGNRILSFGSSYLERTECKHQSLDTENGLYRAQSN